MADVTQTAANVKLKGQTATVQMVQYGETVTQGDNLYPKAADSSKYWRADADTLIEAAASGMALTPGVANDYGLICTGGPVDIGGTLAVGTMYAVSTNPGKFAPISDLASGDFVTPVGVAITTSTLDYAPDPSGIAKA